MNSLLSIQSFGVVFTTVLLYYLLNAKLRVYLLIVLSGYFYYTLAGPLLLIIQYGVILFSYFVSKNILVIDKKYVTSIYYLTIAVAFIPLLFFKYVYSHLPAIAVNSWMANWVFLPLGISYYTFMIVGFVCDVYNRKLKSVPGLDYYTCFISFFPLTLSGPIERTDNFLHQLLTVKQFKSENLEIGLKWILWGCFMKFVLADRIGIYIDTIYKTLDQHSGITMIFTMLLYPFQVYGDLGGYTLIVRGVSKLMGFDILENFRQPFFAQSVTEFWRRWHISLIQWLRDYLFTPVSFYLRKYGIYGTVTAIYITFILSGVWHDFQWKYVLWGVFHASLLTLELLVLKKSFNSKIAKEKSGKWYTLAVKFCIVYILFAISQLFVRVEDMDELKTVFSHLYRGGALFIDKTNLFYAFLAISVIVLRDLIIEFKWAPLFPRQHIAFKVAEIVFLVFSILLFGCITNSSFIYFNF